MGTDASSGGASTDTGVSACNDSHTVGDCTAGDDELTAGGGRGASLTAYRLLHLEDGGEGGEGEAAAEGDASSEGKR